MVLGPWIHSHLLPANAGQRYFGGGASGDGIDYHGMVLAWYDHWLKGEDNGITADPRAYYFTMGDNQWQQAESLASHGPGHGLLPTAVGVGPTAGTGTAHSVLSNPKNKSPATPICTIL